MIFSFTRAWAVFVRFVYHFSHDMQQLIHMFYWPFIDVVIWGFSGIWLEQQQNATPHLAVSLLVAAVCWQIVVYANYKISVSFLEEIQSHNVVSLFASPITLVELFTGMGIFSILMISILILFCAALLYSMYGIVLFSFGKHLFLFFIPLFISGTWIGIISASILFLRGIRFNHGVYMIGWLFIPISGVYNTIAILPTWLQRLAWLFPMAYSFEGIRMYIQQGIYRSDLWMQSTILSIVYCLVTIALLHRSYVMSKRRGLARLID
jgi:ABC-2 type transport system permease protein